jgi:hypothetical protein
VARNFVRGCTTSILVLAHPFAIAVGSALPARSAEAL